MVQPRNPRPTDIDVVEIANSLQLREALGLTAVSETPQPSGSLWFIRKPRPMAVAVSAYELVAKGIFKDAAAQVERLGEVPVNLRVLRAQLEVHVGTPTKARQLAEALLNERLTSSEKSICWELVGRACLSVGQIEDGLRAMGRAFAAVKATEDTKLEAILSAQYTQALLNWVGVEAAALEIPRLRQLAVRSGEPHAMIALHLLVAEINARRGLVSGTTTHLEIARGLLKQFENFWQQGRLRNHLLCGCGSSIGLRCRSTTQRRRGRLR